MEYFTTSKPKQSANPDALWLNLNKDYVFRVTVEGVDGLHFVNRILVTPRKPKAQ